MLPISGYRAPVSVPVVNEQSVPIPSVRSTIVSDLPYPCATAPSLVARAAADTGYRTPPRCPSADGGSVR